MGMVHSFSGGGAEKRLEGGPAGLWELQSVLVWGPLCRLQLEEAH